MQTGARRHDFERGGVQTEVVEGAETKDEDELSPPIQAALRTHMQKLEQVYIQCMRVSLEELDLEPAVYIHGGSELMSQLREE